MSNEITLRIKAAFDALHSAAEAASRWLADRGAPSDVRYFCNLAIEELVTNCIKYGYDDPHEHVIDIELKFSPGELMLTVTDDGRPFNPLEQPEPDTGLPPDQRPIGGLGIHLLRRMSDGMEYIRERGKNRVTLRKVLRR